MRKSNTHLSSPWWKVLERPPYTVLLLSLLDLFADSHDRLAWVVKVKQWVSIKKMSRGTGAKSESNQKPWRKEKEERERTGGKSEFDFPDLIYESVIDA